MDESSARGVLQTAILPLGVLLGFALLISLAERIKGTGCKASWKKSAGLEEIAHPAYAIPRHTMHYVVVIAH